jgi:hypothetical protein
LRVRDAEFSAPPAEGAGIAATHCRRQRSVKPSDQIRLKVM